MHIILQNINLHNSNLTLHFSRNPSIRKFHYLVNKFILMFLLYSHNIKPVILFIFTLAINHRQLNSLQVPINLPSSLYSFNSKLFPNDHLMQYLFKINNIFKTTLTLAFVSYQHLIFNYVALNN